MIDREARNKTIKNIKSLVNGKITNFEYEDNTPNTKDPAILGIDNSIWCFYSDAKTHKLSDKNGLSNEEKQIVNRWILFLYTDKNYQWPSISTPGVRPIQYGLCDRLLFKKDKKQEKFMNAGDYSVWPFIDKMSYDEAKKKFGHLL